MSEKLDNSTYRKSFAKNLTPYVLWSMQLKIKDFEPIGSLKVSELQEYSTCRKFQNLSARKDNQSSLIQYLMLWHHFHRFILGQHRKI